MHDYLLECDPDLWVLSDSKLERLADFYGDILDRETARLFVVADREDRPVGMILVRILENQNVTPSRFGRIDDAWIEPGHRRQGLMRRLIAAAAEFLERQGVRDAMLDYALLNPDSEKCWLALGFRPVVSICRAGVDRLRAGGRR